MEDGPSVRISTRLFTAIGADGTVYANTFDGVLHAFAPDGSLKWTFKTPGNVVDVPSFAGHRQRRHHLFRAAQANTRDAAATSMP